MVELQDHYFDVSGYNEAGMYTSTNKAIVQCLGQQYDWRCCSDTWVRSNVCCTCHSCDHADDQTDDKDKAGAVIKSARSKVNHLSRRKI